jgi:hypothetical protein
MARVGIFKDKLIKEIFPQHPEDVRDAWGIVMPNMPDDGDCLQIDRKYVLSLGAHFTHTSVVLSAKYEVGYIEAIQIANLMSYLFDTLCDLTFPNDEKKSRKYRSGIKSYLRMLGFATDSKYYTSEHRIAEIYETISTHIGDSYTRVLPFDLYGDISRCCSCDLPRNSRLQRAFAVYRQALLSVEPQGKILNYWRVLEAVTDLGARYQLISKFLEDRLCPVKCFPVDHHPGLKPFNLIQRYKRAVKQYFKKLVKTHGSPKKVLDHLYKRRRNPCAHAHSDILEVTHDVSLVSLYRDALLLKYLSRCAIERFWKSL